MGKIASAIVTVTLLTSPLLLPVPASAENGEIAAGVMGGLIGGALLGGALARPAPPPPVYYDTTIWGQPPRQQGNIDSLSWSGKACVMSDSAQ